MQMTLDAWLARIPFRYELLLLLALLIWLLWSVAAGMTGVACGMALLRIEERVMATRGAAPEVVGAAPLWC